MKTPEMIALLEKEADELEQKLSDETSFRRAFNDKSHELLYRYVNRNIDSDKFETLDWLKSYVKSFRNWIDFLFFKLKDDVICVEYKPLQRLHEVLFYVDCILDKSEEADLDIISLRMIVESLGDCVSTFWKDEYLYYTATQKFPKPYFKYNFECMNKFLDNLKELTETCALFYNGLDGLDLFV